MKEIIEYLKDSNIEYKIISRFNTDKVIRLVVGGFDMCIPIKKYTTLNQFKQKVNNKRLEDLKKIRDEHEKILKNVNTLIENYKPVLN